MQLIERYLQAVKFWLPKQQKDDIIAELSADIHAQLDERETALGRQLTEAEVEELLKQRGHPLLVANRFQPQESLIGPVLFPIYRFVMKIFAYGYLLPAVLVWIGLMTFSPSYRFEQTHPSWFTAFTSLVHYLWFATCLVVCPITIVFAAMERNQARVHIFDRWSPGKLPPVRDPNQIPRHSSAVEVAVNLIFFICWAAYMHSPVVHIGSALRIFFAPQWPWFFWSYLLVSAGNIAFSGSNLLHPHWTAWRATLRMLFDAVGAVLFCWLMKSNILAGITAASLSPEKALEFTHAVNGWMNKLFPAAIVVGLVLAAVNVYRIVRLMRSGKSSTA
jgi:hypothetical protein